MSTQIFSKVSHGLYIGDLRTAETSSLLRNHGITAVLSLLSGPISGYTALQECIASLHLRSKHINVDDAPTSSLVPHYGEIIDSLAEQSAPPSAVLVHCLHGSSRSVSAILAYQLSRGAQLDEALSAVRRQHPSACPSPWFLVELRALAASVAANDWPLSFPLSLCAGIGDSTCALLLRAAAVGKPLGVQNCDCALVRCRKCRAELFSACVAFGARDRTAFQILDVGTWDANMRSKQDGRVCCEKCGKKIGCTKSVAWVEAESAGIGRLWVAEMNGSAVDWPLGVAWPPERTFLRMT